LLKFAINKSCISTWWWLVRQLWRLIRRTGRIAQDAPPAPGPVAAPALDGSALHGSAQIRHVDAGSCGGCEIEIGAAFGPVYDAERYGARLVASPRHADVLMVTGVVTRNMRRPLQRTYEAVPGPRWVIAVGDCARNCGELAGGHGVAGAVSDVVPVDLEVPGCPPRPDAVVEAVRKLTGR
jgi:Ni,Fe-hydrogenase III small subunit